MRIALTHAYCWPEVRRGAERFTAELGAALAARGHEVVVLTAAHGHGRSRADGLTTVRLRQFRDHGLGHEADFGRRVVPWLVAGRFDAVHSLGRRDAVGSIRAARLHRRRRTVFTDLGIPHRDYWEHQLGETAFHDRVVRDIDEYGCMSRFALEVLRREYGRDGVLTPGGVNLEQFVPQAERTPAPTLLFSGALYEPRKGVGTLLQAAAILAVEEPGLRVWLSGPGDVAPLLREAPAVVRGRTDALGLGEPTRQAERYGRAWVTVLASKHDSFGMALVESLACGTPIVASTHSAVPELVDPGVTGALCPPDDPLSLAQACREAIELARRPETVEACRGAAAPFDWRTALAPRFERLYRGS